MNEKDIKEYIDITAENIALKIEKKICESIRSHEKNCFKLFDGRISLLENHLLRDAKPTWAIEVFGPIVGTVVKNWKAVAVAIILIFSTVLGFKSEKSLSKDDIVEIVEHLKQVDSTLPTNEIEEYQVN